MVLALKDHEPHLLLLLLNCGHLFAPWYHAA
jgi:hypothetical protein